MGAAREILDAFAADRGYRLTYRPLPIKRLYAALVHSEIDCKFPDNPQWAIEVKAGKNVAYSQAVIRFVDGVMVLPDNRDATIDAIKSLSVVAGFTPYGWQERIRSGAVEQREANMMEQTLQQVLHRRTDGAYVSVAVANHALSAILQQPGALVFAPGLPHGIGAYQLSSIGRPEVVAEFDAWLAANAGRVQAIKDRLGAEAGLGAIPTSAGPRQ
jgi:hypothetical protein